MPEPYLDCPCGRGIAHEGFCVTCGRTAIRYWSAVGRLVKAAKAKDRRCVVCGEPIPPTMPKAIMCSNRCRLRSSRERKRREAKALTG